MTKYKKGGRPTLEESQRRSYSLNIRLNFAELERLKFASAEAGITESEYARQAITKGKVKPRLTPEIMNLIRSLSGMDNNLNQIARQANAAGYTNVRSEYLHLANRVDNIINSMKN